MQAWMQNTAGHGKSLTDPPCIVAMINGRITARLGLLTDGIEEPAVPA